MAAIREITLEVYTALPKGHPGPSLDFASELPGAEPELSEAERKLLDQVCIYMRVWGVCGCCWLGLLGLLVYVGGAMRVQSSQSSNQSSKVASESESLSD